MRFDWRMRSPGGYLRRLSYGVRKAGAGCWSDPHREQMPGNMRHSQYAKQLMKQAEDETKRLYGILEQKYGKTDTYSESYAPAENK